MLKIKEKTIIHSKIKFLTKELAIEKDRNIMWSEMSNIIRRALKQIIG